MFQIYQGYISIVNSIILFKFSKLLKFTIFRGLPVASPLITWFITLGGIFLIVKIEEICNKSIFNFCTFFIFFDLKADIMCEDVLFYILILYLFIFVKIMINLINLSLI